MKKHLRWRWLFVAFATICLGIVGYFALTMPTTMRIAVGPEGGALHRYARAIAEALRESGQTFRFDIVTTANMLESSAALDARRVDLAILRSDELGSKEAQSVAVLQRLSIIVLARKDRNIEKLEDFRGRRIVIVATGGESNKTLVERLTLHFGLGPNDVAITEELQSVAGRGMTAGEYDAIVLVLNVAGERARRIVGTLVERNPQLRFFSFEAAEALAARFAEVQAIEIPAGIFGGAPLRPPEEIDTVALTYELVARASLSREKIATLTRAIMNVRSRLLRDNGREFVVETPPLDQARRFVPHAGVESYVNDEIKTFLETWSDHIWLALFGFSLLGTSVSAMLGWVGIVKAPESQDRIHQLPGILDDLAKAATAEDLRAVEQKIDRVIEIFVRDTATGAYDLDNRADPSPMLRLLADVVSRRRTELEARARNV